MAWGARHAGSRMRHARANDKARRRAHAEPRGVFVGTSERRARAAIAAKKNVARAREASKRRAKKLEKEKELEAQQQQQQHSHYAVEGGGNSYPIDPLSIFSPTHPDVKIDFHDVHLINEARSMHQYHQTYNASSATLDRSILPPNSSNFVFDEDFVFPAINTADQYYAHIEMKSGEIVIDLATKFTQREYKEVKMGLIKVLTRFDADEAHQIPPNLVCFCFCGCIGERGARRQKIYEDRYHAVANYLENVNEKKFMERGIEVNYVNIGGLEGLMVDVSPWNAQGEDNKYWDGERPFCIGTPVLNAVEEEPAAAVEEAPAAVEEK